MNILLADDHSLFVEGLQNLLEAGGYRVVGIASNGLKALEMARVLRPDVVLMDICMPVLDGITTTRLIKSELPQVKVVILTMSAEEDDLFEALRSGASGYLLKNLKPNALFSYLEGLGRGEAPLSRELSSRLMREFNRLSEEVEHRCSPTATQVKLTVRQREILELAAQGLMYKEIAAVLYLSENTVKYHMGEILQRLKLKNREQVVAYALRTGLVHLKAPGPSTPEVKSS